MLSEETILEALKQVRDPELLVNVVDLGLVYGVGVEEVEGKTNIQVVMTMTTPACPFGPELIQEVKDCWASWKAWARSRCRSRSARPGRPTA